MTGEKEKGVKKRRRKKKGKESWREISSGNSQRGKMRSCVRTLSVRSDYWWCHYHQWSGQAYQLRIALFLYALPKKLQRNKTLCHPGNCLNLHLNKNFLSPFPVLISTTLSKGLHPDTHHSRSKPVPSSRSAWIEGQSAHQCLSVTHSWTVSLTKHGWKAAALWSTSEGGGTGASNTSQAATTALHVPAVCAPVSQ